LGSQPKSLRRYEELYKAIGFAIVLTRIAPPYAVVQSVFQHPLEPIQLPSGWPNHCSVQHNSITTIQDIAWDILREVHNEDCSAFYFHAFSNGGCFVWEQLRRILLAPSNEHGSNGSPSNEQITLTSETADILSSVREKLAGVAFDSCPIAEFNRVDEALNHCSSTERAAVERYCGLDYMHMKDDPELQARVQRRINSYVSGLRDDPLRIPQLYLYCRDDPLAPAPFIDDLVQHRSDIAGSDQVIRRVWDNSMHCSHLLKHSQEYTGAVEAFVELGALQEERRSKL
jgi:Eukaryotic protein of unknown function (DUF829)